MNETYEMMNELSIDTLNGMFAVLDAVGYNGNDAEHDAVMGLMLEIAGIIANRNE